MISRRRLSDAALLLGLIALMAFACGGGGTVPSYAPCTAADTCPTSTTCEPSSATSTSAGGGATFCTWSCGGSGGGSPSCPKDANGVEGVCVVSVNGTMVGGSGDAGLGREDTEFGFCFQDCSSGGTCPSGETCEPAQLLSGSGQQRVCMPVFKDPLGGTSWQSDLITPAAKSYGITMSTYTITFGATTETVGGYASGPYRAKLTEIYGSLAFEYAGCTETDAFTGQWIDMPPTATSAGTLTVSNLVAITNRTGCTSSNDDTSGEGQFCQADGDQSASYTLSGNTMTIQGGSGITPHDVNVSWTFTER
jgi:hypothetical protein